MLSVEPPRPTWIAICVAVISCAICVALESGYACVYHVTSNVVAWVTVTASLIASATGACNKRRGGTCYNANADRNRVHSV